MQRWCFAVTASRVEGTVRNTHICPGVLEARSRAEAEGLAWQLARKGYPAAEGWRDHFAVVDDAAKTTDPGKPVEFGPTP